MAGLSNCGRYGSDRKQLLHSGKLGRRIDGSGYGHENALRHGTLFSAAYYRVARDTDEIACVTLSAILQAYKEKIEKSGQELSGSLEEKICGKAGGYQNLFQTFFEEKLKTLLPNETEQEFLKYLPQMAVMQENKSEPRKGFFSRFAGNMREEKAAAITGTDPQVTKSVCMMAFRQYYQEPIRQWLASEEGKHRRVSGLQNVSQEDSALKKSKDV